MEIDSLHIQVTKSSMIEGVIELHTAVYVDSRYLGKQVYEYRKFIGKNDFEDLFSIMMEYAKHEIKDVINKHHLAKLKRMKGKK